MSQELPTSLRKHLEGYGFNDSYFSEETRGAMVTVGKNKMGDWESVITTPNKSMNSKVRPIPVSEFLWAGDSLKFSSSMKLIKQPPVTLGKFLRNPVITALALCLMLAGRLMKLDLAGMSQIEGWVCGYRNPPFSAFPCDSWMQVTSIDTTWLNLQAPNGLIWQLGTVVLTAPEHIDFSRSSHPLL